MSSATQRLVASRLACDVFPLLLMLRLTQIRAGVMAYDARVFDRDARYDNRHGIFGSLSFFSRQ